MVREFNIFRIKPLMIANLLLFTTIFFEPAYSAIHEEKPMNSTATEIATFAGGCFWCMQTPFDKVGGVIATTVGYTGGHVVDPSYEMVSSGSTGHVESIQVVYDPMRISYRELLNIYWHQIDPFNQHGQFCDMGNQYRAIIFYHNETQQHDAQESKKLLQKQFADPIMTEIIPASTFYPAEEYHQKYYQKNPIRYHFYRYSCGRDKRLKEVWGTAATD